MWFCVRVCVAVVVVGVVVAVVVVMVVVVAVVVAVVVLRGCRACKMVAFNINRCGCCPNCVTCSCYSAILMVQYVWL